MLILRPSQKEKHSIGEPVSWDLQVDVPIQPALNRPVPYGASDPSAFLYHCVVEAEITQILPDTYTQPTEILGGDLWQIVEMKTRDVVAGENMPESFYLMLPDGYGTGLTKYESFLLVIKQKGIAGDTLVNTQQCRYERFYPAFTLRMSGGVMRDYDTDGDGERLFYEQIKNGKASAFCSVCCRIDQLYFVLVNCDSGRLMI